MSRPADPHARASLIASARKEFWRHGIKKARIEDITTSSGLSKGAFYLHFESKEALFRELVSQLSEGMDTLVNRRISEEHAFFEGSGSVNKRERLRGSKRLREMQLMSRRNDLEVLELLWSQRDIAHVLLNGAQGTEFDGLIWAMVDREMKRVGESCERLKHWGVCRRDVSSELMGTMLIGSWLMLLRRMIALHEKPDLESWLAGLSLMLENGMTGRPEQPEAAPANPTVNSRRRSPPRRLRSLP